MKTARLTRISLLAAMGLVLMLTVEFPLIPQAPYLKYDPSEVPAMIGAFAMGWKAGLAIITIKSILFFLMKGDMVGTFMAFFASCFFVLPASLLYSRSRTLKTACYSLVSGTLSLVLGMSVLNMIVLPFYLQIPLAQTVTLVLTVIPLFNLIKGIANSVLTFMLYKRISPYLKT